MLDSVQKRAAMIEHLETTLRLANELVEGDTAYLIDRALDEARGYHLISIHKTNRRKK